MGCCYWAMLVEHAVWLGSGMRSGEAVVGGFGRCDGEKRLTSLLGSGRVRAKGRIVNISKTNLRDPTFMNAMSRVQ